MLVAFLGDVITSDCLRAKFATQCVLFARRKERARARVCVCE